MNKFFEFQDFLYKNVNVLFLRDKILTVLLSM